MNLNSRKIIYFISCHGDSQNCGQKTNFKSIKDLYENKAPTRATSELEINLKVPEFPYGSSWEHHRDVALVRACPVSFGVPRTCAWSSHPESVSAVRSSAASSSRTSSGRSGCCRREWYPVQRSRKTIKTDNDFKMLNKKKNSLS